MKWSFGVARIAGIELRIHVTFFLIILLGGMQWSSFGANGAVFGTILMALLFACVTLHEFGHALVAQRLGIRVREIVLLPIGGVAMLSRSPSTPLQELLITVAGPLVNVVLIVILGVTLSVKIAAGSIDIESLLAFPQFEPSFATALIWLLNANIALVVFNMIPAFPLDGGRVLRAALGFFMPWARATAVATWVGQVIALLLGLAAFATGMWLLMLISVLIFFGAGSTRVQENARSVLATRRVGDACNRYALALSERDRLCTVIDYLLTSYQTDFAVMRNGELLGIVRREDALRALQALGEDVAVTEIMRTDFPRLPGELMLDEAAERLNESGVGVGAVYARGAFLGLVNTQDIAEAAFILQHMPRTERPGCVPARPHLAGGDA